MLVMVVMSVTVCVLNIVTLSRLVLMEIRWVVMRLAAPEQADADHRQPQGGKGSQADKPLVYVK